jgi:hypothetical protein
MEYKKRRQVMYITNMPKNTIKTIKLKSVKSEMQKGR